VAAALPAAACAAIVLSGCGTQPAATHQPGAAAASPRQRAVADAAHIIASFPRPPGAVRTGLIASLTAPGMGPQATPDVATATQWWRVPGRPQAVLAWIRAHLPPGFRPGASGSGPYEPSPSVTLPESWTNVYALPPVPGVLTQRWLVVLAVPDHRQIAIRADAQVVWRPARPAAEQIPSDARAVTVTPVFGLNADEHLEHQDRAFIVTDPARVARIAAVVDGLPLFPDGMMSCPNDTGAAVRLTFTTAPGGPVVARATAADGGCGGVSVTVDGWAMPALWDDPASGPPLLQRVLGIAGVNWPYPLSGLSLPDLAAGAAAVSGRLVQGDEARPEQELGVRVRRAVRLGHAVGEPHRGGASVRLVDLAQYVVHLASGPDDPGRPLA
jgi:hypothetical protein